MKVPFAIVIAIALAAALRADATLSNDPSPAYNTSPDPHPSLGAPPAQVVAPTPAPATYPSLAAAQGVTSTPGPAVPGSHLWEVQPTFLAGLASHGNLQGPAIELVLDRWFTAQVFVGLHSDGRYNAVSQGLDLRLFPTGHSPRGAYLEAQDDFVQENAAPPTQGVYHAQRVGLGLGWQWLLRGSISVNVAGAWTQEDATYSSHPYPAIGSNHDSAVDRSQAALDLGLGWYF
ncbi:MAG TPA: hypothetical protein VNZ67_10260 [bacterium]|jgi:hypothetical protein|nr:hypothetical protein [bacterium]